MNTTMLNVNASRHISQSLPSTCESRVTTQGITSNSSRLIPPPCRLSLAPQHVLLISLPRRNFYAVKNHRRHGQVTVVSELSLRNDDNMEEVDYDYDDEEDDEEEEQEEEESDEEVGGLYLGFGDMQKWFQNKPRGFGEGKAYDTSIEDKLLEEMRQSRIAQAANINKLKSGGDSSGNAGVKKPKHKKEEKQVKDAENEVVPTGIQVRIGNLPKKKNIHRDLNLAFKGVAGISAIVPAVSGNKKTRDPVCLGFAHVYFKTEEDASRFVQMFSGKALTFGRVQKQIKCAMMNPSLISAQEISDKNPHAVSQLALPVLDKNPDLSSLLGDVDFIEAEFQQMGENLEYLEVSDFEDAEADRNSTADPLTSALNQQKEAGVATKQQKKAQPSKKAPAAKAKSKKAPQLDVPGSAKRLKIKEKAVLTGVLSKYQSMAAAVSSEGR